MITLSGITYGYSLKSPVLEGIDLRSRRGKFIGVLGPNGSGKTTLLKIIIGLIKPWLGSIIFDNKLSSGSNKITLGYVPQVESVDWNFPVTVREVVGMGIWNQSGITPWFVRNAKEQVQDLLESLGIGEYDSRQIRELSGGEQQRVFLARALIRNPDVLVLDEPTSGVDYNSREKILGILNDLNIKGMTILVTTHDIAGMATRLPWLVCINRNIIAEGKPENTLTETNLLKTYGLSEITSIHQKD
jgi:ABC-type Mn2+/Zn2+ transport system ATPase subunit